MVLLLKVLDRDSGECMMNLNSIRMGNTISKLLVETIPKMVRGRWGLEMAACRWSGSRSRRWNRSILEILAAEKTRQAKLVW